ncbi:MAG: DMT family transporter [Rhodanobacteraceae bacterium]
MVASAVSFGLMAIVIRYASATVHPFEIAFFRSVFGVLFALPLVLIHGTAILRTRRLGFYFLRCVIGMGSMLAAFWAMVHLPLAQAIALSYSTPMFVTIGAVLVLGEVVRMRRWSAVVIGFIGVLVIVRPGAETFTVASLVPLLAAALSGSVTISIKFLARSEHPDTIVLWTTLLWVPLSLPAALPVWHMPEAGVWPWLALTGLLGTAGHWCWTRALKLADASLIAPIGYLQLLIVAVLAWWLFGEKPGPYTGLGAAIIIGASVYIAHREAMLARQRKRLTTIAANAPLPRPPQAIV